MIELECGHWLDYEHWLERETDHKISIRLQELEIQTLRSKLQAVKEAVIDIKPRQHSMATRMQDYSLARQQALGARQFGQMSGCQFTPPGWPHGALI